MESDSSKAPDPKHATSYDDIFKWKVETGSTKAPAYHASFMARNELEYLLDPEVEIPLFWLDDQDPDDIQKKDLRVPYADLVVTCGDLTLHTHSAILCQRSRFFQTYCNGASDTDKTVRIDFDRGDHHPDAVAAMIEFVYQSAVATSQYAPISGKSQLVRERDPEVADLYKLAVLYDLQNLRTFVTEKYVRMLDNDTSTAQAMALRATYDDDRPWMENWRKVTQEKFMSVNWLVSNHLKVVLQGRPMEDLEEQYPEMFFMEEC